VERVPVTGVNELVLEVANLPEAEEFYVEVLGFPVVERWGRHAVWVMAGERTRIGLWLPQIGLGGGRGGVHVHYSLAIGSAAYDAAVRRLREAGYDVYDHNHSDYGEGRGRAAYVTDPAGHVVELWTWNVAKHLSELERGESPGSR
jgi:catechol 2,3-dioxygenase-like lactoylglutathione lyase family enzyme